MKTGLKRTVDATSEPVTLSEVKSHLRIDSSDEDSYLYGLITAARNLAEHYTNTSIFTQTWVKTMEYFPYGRIELPRGPVASISSLKYYNDSNVLTTYDSSNYRLDNSGSISVIDADNLDWPSAVYERSDAVEITYVAGYSTIAAIPQAIKQAILMITGHLYENRQDVITGTQVNKMPMGSRYLLDPFRVDFIEYPYRYRFT